jgi:hypothetical protein
VTFILLIKFRLRVFENRVLRKIMGAKREEGNGEECMNKEIYILYCSTNNIWVMK